MNKNQKGFSAVEFLLAIVVVGMIAAAGWYVMNRNKTTGDQTNISKQQNENQAETEVTPNSTPYKFEKLGLTMDILDGWKVTFKQTEEFDEPGYHWTVGKEGVEYFIVLSSVAPGPRGYYDCEESAAFTRAFLRDTATTKNNKLVFLAWSYNSDGGTVNNVGIALADQAMFTHDDDPTAPTVKNSDLHAGNYFICLESGLPGDLHLVDEMPANGLRHDYIGVSDSKGQFNTFSTDAESYTDIKTMLTSLR